MNSVCIKTNNSEVLEYLENTLIDIDLENTCFIQKKFKYYKNIIIHYSGNYSELFFTKLATYLSYIVIDFFEENILKKIISHNYFYFDSAEINKILDLCFENLSSDDKYSLNNRELLLFDLFYDYISTHKSIVLTGFINFRLSKYKEILENVVDISVNEYLIEREYTEFISILKLYIDSRPSITNKVYLIFSNSIGILLNENLETIDTSGYSLDYKYLSDINFSKNDCILNTLIDLLPQKVIIYLTDLKQDLEFINTLKLIFENRIEIHEEYDFRSLKN